jgi:serine/threonine protein kinase
MASFAHSLRSFCNGGLSLDELLNEIDRILDDGRSTKPWLLEVLDKENAKKSLSTRAYEAIRQRIEHAVVQTKPVQINERTLPLSDNEILTGPQSKADHKFHVSASSSEDSLKPAWRNHVTNPSKLPDPIPQSTPKPIAGTGDVLNNRFELRECLGSGGMSTVYKALDRRKLEANDRNPYVAVKILNLEFRAHPNSLIALQREAKKCLSLAHPNIVRVYDFDRDGETVYMTMEYLSGESLGKITGARNFEGMSFKDALPIINAMGKALAFAHNCGIVHADFKPANVFITDQGHIKVIDFGIARAFKRADEPSLEATIFDPRSLGALTPTYASPEMLEKRESDPRDDIYALACTIYELLTGQHPFGRTPAIFARTRGLVLERNKTLPRRFYKALQGALEFDREKRTPTVERFLEQINSKSETPKRLAITSGIAGLVMLLGAAIGYYSSYLTYVNGMISETDQQETNTTQPIIPPITKNEADRADVNLPDNQVNESGQAPKATDESEQSTELAPLNFQTNEMTQSILPDLGLQEVSLESIEPLLIRLPCSALEALIIDNRINIKGYASQSSIERLEGELAALTGASNKVSLHINRLNANKCDMIELLSPFWLINRKIGAGTSIQAKGSNAEFEEGDNIILEIHTPPYASYLNVDYFSVDGGVIHMVPSPRARQNQAPADYKAIIGDLGEWRVGSPFGRELIAILATPEPLYKELRTEYEPQSDYLPDLRKRLNELAAKVGDSRITADILLIETFPKNRE